MFSVDAQIDVTLNKLSLITTSSVGPLAIENSIQLVKAYKIKLIVSFTKALYVLKFNLN